MILLPGQFIVIDPAKQGGGFALFSREGLLDPTHNCDFFIFRKCLQLFVLSVEHLHEVSPYPIVGVLMTGHRLHVGFFFLMDEENTSVQVIA